MGKIKFLFLLTAIVIIVDHALKYFAKSSLAPSFLKYTVNTGAAFSLLSGLGFTKILLICVSIIILLVVGFFYFKHHKSFLLAIALILIFAGTLSNLIDRVFLGHVIDYIPVPFLGIKGLTFNLADVANISGVVLLIIHLIKR
jgi:signal peptidase II